MLEYIPEYTIYSYIIVISVTLIQMLIVLYLGNNIDAEDIAIYLCIVIAAPIVVICGILIILLIAILYAFYPLAKVFKKLHINIPKISNYELKSRQQLRAELILADYKKEQLSDGTVLYEKDGVYIILNSMTMTITYKVSTESFITFSIAKTLGTITKFKLMYI